MSNDKCPLCGVGRLPRGTVTCTCGTIVTRNGGVVYTSRECKAISRRADLLRECRKATADIDLVRRINQELGEGEGDGQSDR